MASAHQKDVSALWHVLYISFCVCPELLILKWFGATVIGLGMGWVKNLNKWLQMCRSATCIKAIRAPVGTKKDVWWRGYSLTDVCVELCACYKQLLHFFLFSPQKGHWRLCTLCSFPLLCTELCCQKNLENCNMQNTLIRNTCPN